MRPPAFETDLGRTPVPRAEWIVRAMEAGCGFLISRYTRLTPAQWESLSRDFPSLGADPALPALRHRLRRSWQIRRARRNPAGARLEWHGEPPVRAALFVSTHSNPLRELRYLLRAQGLGVTSISRTDPSQQSEIARDDRRIDRLFPSPLPHRLRPDNTRAILRALQTSILLSAVDLHEGSFISPMCLKGRVSVSLMPFRLARLAGVTCRPIFVRSRPSGLETIVEACLDVSDERQAAESFAAVLARYIGEWPFDMISNNFRIDNV